MSDRQPPVLRANLAALDRTQPELARRLRWSVANDHVLRRKDGTLVLRVGAQARSLHIPSDALAHFVRRPPGEPGALLLGIGLGEAVEVALKVWPDTHITAWDRDPWLMRMLLSRCDLTRPILTRRLRLLLGPDLLELDPTAHAKTFEHPLLARVYGQELATWRNPAPQGVVLCCTEGLFVDDVEAELKQRGLSIWRVDVKRVDAEEFRRTLTRIQPRLGIAINQVVRLPEVFESAQVPLLTWEIDPAIDWLPEPSEPVPHSHLFTFRRQVARQLAGSNHGSTTWLPLAAPDRRRPAPPTDEEREKFAASVSFVGSSMAARARPYAARVKALLVQWLKAHERPVEGVEALLKAMVDAQRAQETEWCLPERMDMLAPGFREWTQKAGVTADPALLLGELPAAEHRLRTVVSLAPFGMQVWGDPGWQSIASSGVGVRGFAGHFHALNRIYQLSTINIDIGRIYQPDIVTMRVFDVLACGGFLLAAHSEELEALFEVGVEVESWRTRAELFRKVEHYLAHPEEASAISQRGHRAVLERHRVDQRVDRMLEVAGIDLRPQSE